VSGKELMNSHREGISNLKKCAIRKVKKKKKRTGQAQVFPSPSGNYAGADFSLRSFNH